MILHRLIWRHLRRRDDAEFYRLQATDAIRWMERNGVEFSPRTEALDLGCGHGILGREIAARGSLVTFADATNLLLPELRDRPFRRVDLDRDSLEGWGEWDVVVCSNVLEHLRNPKDFLRSARRLVRPQGWFYLSWTNWLSPWGGHEFSPFHYLGARLGPRIYEKVSGRKRIHTPGTDLFPTFVGDILRFIRAESGFRIARAAPRYYPELSFLLRAPGLREVASWNVALLLARDEDARGGGFRAQGSEGR